MRDAARTKAAILREATREFADRGYASANLNDIASRTHATKRMIYFYFGSKEQLYAAVLEAAYDEIGDAEETLDLEHLDPVSAIRALAEASFDFHDSHRDFVRLVCAENVRQGTDGQFSPAVPPGKSGKATGAVAAILEAGRRQGVFHASASPIDIRMLISSFCFFRISNRNTFGALFSHDMTTPALRDHYRRMVGDVVVAYLTSGSMSD
jgi:AcrR family transcriptional regulator